MNGKKYQALKSKIIKANPEIVDLKFGCEIKGFSEALGRTFFLEKGKDNSSEWIAVYPENGIKGNLLERPIYSISASFPAKIEYEILGRPIRLADVLLAMQKLEDDDDDRNWVVNRFGEFLKDREDIPAVDVGMTWNLKKDDLDLQTDETKQFLINLLVK